MDQFDEAMKEYGIKGTAANSPVYKAMKDVIKEHPTVLESLIGTELDKVEEAVRRVRLYTNPEVVDIRDINTRDAVMAFANVLRIVKDIFGEERMSENIMLQAIEAGSYIGYRTIMGEAAQTAPYKRR